MKYVTTAGLAGLSLLFCAGAQAATLTPVAGEVLVNSGAGYKPVAGPVEVKPGDSILVNPEGSAQLTYDACATFEIKPGDVVYVAERETVTCVSGAEGAGGLAAAGGLGVNSLVIGGLAVAVGAGVVAGVSSGSDTPSSP